MVRLGRRPVFAAPAALLLTAALAWWLGGLGKVPAAGERTDTLAFYASSEQPRRALFPEFRLSWDGPEVRLPDGDEWCRWLAVEGLDVTTLWSQCPGETPLERARSLALDHLEILAAVRPDAPAERLTVTLRPLGGRDPIERTLDARPRHRVTLAATTIENVAPIRPGSRETERSHDAYSAAAAFSELRLTGDGSGCEVQLEDGWHELLGIFDMPLAEALELVTNTFPDASPAKRFHEDFAETLERQGYRVGETMHVLLRGPDGAPERRTVPFTEDVRRSITRGRLERAMARSSDPLERFGPAFLLLTKRELQVSCFDAWTWKDGRALVEVAGRSGELRAVAGHPLDEIKRRSLREYGILKWPRFTREHLMVILTLLGEEVGPTLDVTLFDPVAGAEVELAAVPLSHAKWQQLIEDREEDR